MDHRSEDSWTPAVSIRALPGFNRTQSPDLPDVLFRVSPRYRSAFFAVKRRRLSQWSSETHVAVGAGIEPAESALTVRSVFQHTSPTRVEAALRTRCTSGRLRLHGRPPRASPHAVTPFSDCQRSRAHFRPGFREPDSNQHGAVQSRMSCQLDDPEMVADG